MAPTGRLRSFEEIEELSKPTAYDPERSFKDQLRAIDTLRDQSFQHRQKGDLENAYIFMARAAGLVVDKLPFHSQYDILSAKQKTDLAANGQSMLRVLADLRPQLVERYKDYLATRSNGILPPPRNPKGYKSKGTVSPPGEIQMPRTPTSIEDKSSRALTSSGPTPGVTIMLTEAQERERQGDGQRVRRMQSTEASRSTREYNIPTPVPTPSPQEPPQLSQPHRYASSHDEGNHHSDFEPSISRFQQSYDADLKPRSNASGPLNETARMRQALDLENAGISERRWGEAKDRGIQDGGMPTRQREAQEQAALQEQRVANVRDGLTRRPVDAQAPRQAEAEAREKAEWDTRAAERAREDQANREVQSRIAREMQRRALADADIIERQRKATEVQVKIAREPQDRVMREAASDPVRRDSQEQRMPRPSLDGGIRHADSFGHSPIPLQASYPVTREQSNLLSGNLRQSLSSPGYPDTAAPLYPSQSASAHSSRLNDPGQIGIVPPSIPYNRPDPTAEAALPILTLESPSHSRPYFLSSTDDGRGSSVRDHKRMYPSPIVTTTSPPREPGHFSNVPKAYPGLMTTHQKDQGYQPSPQSIFAQSEPQEDDTPHALLFQPLGVKEIPPKSDPTLNAPQWPSSRSMNPSPQPVQVLNMSSRSSPYPEYTGTAGPPPVPPFSHLLHGPSRSEPSVTPRLRQLMLPVSTLPRFLSVAAVNTAQKRETCGLLLGKHVGNSFRISTLLIPKQTATENTSSMTHEELVAQVQLTRDLITLGWIHTHPTQSCFMSSLDLHTHSGYQSSLPEAIAIVCAPKSTPNFGIFRLTDPPGLGMIQSCRNKASFHPHSDSEPIYTDADSDHVQMVDDAYLEIIDLR